MKFYVARDAKRRDSIFFEKICLTLQEEYVILKKNNMGEQANFFDYIIQVCARVQIYLDIIRTIENFQRANLIV